MQTTETTAECDTNGSDRGERIGRNLDLSDAYTRREFEKVKKMLAKAESENTEPDKVMATIDDPALIDCLDDILVSEVALEAGTARAKFLKRKRELAVEKAKLLIEEVMEIDLEDTGGLDVLRRCIRRDDPDRRVRVARKFVEAGRRIRELDDETVKASAEGELSGDAATLVDDDVPSAFVKDICEVLIENGRKARELLEKIITDCKVATKVAMDAEMPHSVRYLAAMVQHASEADAVKEAHDAQDEKQSGD